ncbi:alpha-2-macroglobulin family protein [Chitinophaga tropicalis]|nr:alpha-2-macroglobulin family protein [Chitinophaga tropicalis]
MAQMNYETQWKKVTELETKGLPKSALEEVNLIYENALKQKQEAQLIKTLLYRLKLIGATGESPDRQKQLQLDARLLSLSAPVKALTHSIRAELLMQYLQNHRYDMYGRTTVASDTSTNVDTWNVTRLHEEISAAYEASLEDAAALKLVEISKFDDVLTKGVNTRQLRPTLYDLLAHRALDYYKSGESRLNNPASQFELTDVTAFAPAAEFMSHHFAATDSAALQYKAILLLQDLMRFHAKDKSALLDLDLERTAYMNQVGVMQGKDALYLKLLKQQEKEYEGEKDVTRVIYLLAVYYYNEGNKKTENAALGMTPSAAMLLAKSYAERGEKLAPTSPGGANCTLLLQSIAREDLKLQTELVNLPAEPFRSLVTYRNLKKIYLRVVPIDENFRKMLRRAREDYRDTENRYWKLMVGKRPLKTWEQSLTGTEDFREHAAEIKIDALPLGLYMLVASAGQDFSLNDNLLAVQFIHVSNISYIQQDSYNDEVASRYYALHRKTGKPLAGIKLNIWQSGNGNEDRLKMTESMVSGKDGSLSLNYGSRGSIRLQWIDGADTLFIDDYKYVYTYGSGKEEEPVRNTTFFFTDRAIYRPGQTVYFKGIVVGVDPAVGKSKVVSDLVTNVTLYDANNEEVASQSLTSNEYGTFSGKFRLPEGRLNGEFRLEENAGHGSISFAVEEYKRPKFYVEFDSVKGSYRVNDSVKITGKALAYAGNNVDGAKVKYRVVRQARFPYPWLMWRIPYHSEPREIIHGETETGADGTFNVTFPALPDLSVPAATKPVFSYIVTADVTDLNGETRSGEETVSAGYQSLEIKLTLNDRLQAKDLEKITVQTQNLSGTFEPAEVVMTLSPVRPPARLLRERYWSKPDQFIIPQEEYEKDFPHDIYKDEDEKESWERKAAVQTKAFVTKQGEAVALDSKQLQPGWYELKVSSKDKYGEEVVQKKLFEIVDPGSKKLSYPSYSWLYAGSDKVEPGEKQQLLIGSSAEDVHVIQILLQPDDKETVSTFDISNGIENRDYTAVESDRGGVHFQYAFVKDNRAFTISQMVNVPWTNKQLEVTVASHRDKLLPGAKEEWKVTVKGYKGAKTAAEMVAAMYDASLDAFRQQTWYTPSIYPTISSPRYWNIKENFKDVISIDRYDRKTASRENAEPFTYDELNMQDNYLGGAVYLVIDKDGRLEIRESERAREKRRYLMKERARLDDAVPAAPVAAMSVVEGKVAGVKAEEMDSAAAGGVPGAAEKPKAQDESVQPRKNFNETAFFLPELRTDENGDISFNFTVPEALTRWRFLGLAHTKDAAFGAVESSVVTQKPLMVQPNAPRFMREGDKIRFSAKISNMADSALTGEARLELLDAATMKPVDGWFQNVFPVQHFTVQKGQSTAVVFPVDIPYNFGSSLLYRIVAKSGAFSDGEENALPVLTNNMLVTETLPLAMRGDGTRTFTMPKLQSSGTSETLMQYAYTVEFSANPAWYAVQALPYLMEYPHECSEQIFNRYYANTLATHVANAIPGVKNIFDEWRTSDTAALQSNLQKNQELKSVLLQETPWVMEAESETEQKKRIALLFDLHRMSGEQSKAIGQLQQRQLPSGAFPWFNMMWEDRFITQYIVAGIGRLQQVGALQGKDMDAVQSILSKGVDYLDREIDKSYYELKKNKIKMTDQHIGYIEAHYLYTRSLLKNVPLADKYKVSYQYYLSQAKQYWLQQDVYAQAMLAVALKRSGDAVTASSIIRSLKEHASVNEEMGMYWKTLHGGYWWYQAPIESQAMLIEAFTEVTNDTTAIGDMKTWLLKNKQTNNWHTTKATADACYAMLLGGSNWLSATPVVNIKAGNEVISSTTQKTEAGTGYFKQRFDKDEVKPAMGKIEVSVQGSKGQPSWGAVYWQYFEQLDKITPAATPLKLEKTLFIEKNTDKGPVLTAIEDGNRLKVGDKVKVRVVMKVDRDMEYIHLRDMRAACFEPTNVISESKWQNGVSYYESTKDASTNFFFSRLPKGTYVFEYPMFVTHEGDFSNGISTAQCMYAPEFSAHSEGIRVKVVE